MILYRPVNFAELKLIIESGYRFFPPRLNHQPIFYPVTDINYAITISKDWNVPAYGASYVTKFEVDDEYISQFEVHNVGLENHNELWIPSEELDIFNSHIAYKIEITHSFEKGIPRIYGAKKSEDGTIINKYLVEVPEKTLVIEFGQIFPKILGEEIFGELYKKVKMVDVIVSFENDKVTMVDMPDMDFAKIVDNEKNRNSNKTLRQTLSSMFEQKYFLSKKTDVIFDLPENLKEKYYNENINCILLDIV